MSKITYVTSLVNIGRDQLDSDMFKRSFEVYLNNFKKLLSNLKDSNLVVYIEPQHEDFVSKYKEDNIIIRHITRQGIRETEYYDKIQKIRTCKKWRNQVSWLSESTQADLELYNPLIFQKIHLLDDVSAENPFDSEYFLWIDAGIAGSQADPGYFSRDWFEDEIVKYINGFLFLCFPYYSDTEIHGFDIKKMCEFCETDSVIRVARATFFGGKRDNIKFLTKKYREIAHKSLDEGYMGTEESIFTILTYLYEDYCTVEMIDQNGLVSSFFDRIQDAYNTGTSYERRTDLYVVTFNAPTQFYTLCESLIYGSPEMFSGSDKYVVNNSTDKSFKKEYNELFKEYGFKVIHEGGNSGICGGRQLIAEHFNNTENEYMLFFEDDMILNSYNTNLCKFGLPRYHKQLYYTALKIINQEKYDFLKLSFSEYWGDNSTQWAWYNVSQNTRDKKWPDNSQLPETGFSANVPNTQFNSIKSVNGLPYTDGEIYYCNWPHIISKSGNKKIFIDRVSSHPTEQDWMSQCYEMVQSNEIRPGLLLISPITHHRFAHYDSDDRKES